MGLCCSKPDIKDEESEHHVEFGAGNVHLITTKVAWDQKLEEARSDGKIVIANFSATWCGPCKMIAPFYCELSEKYPSLMFLVVDVDELSYSWSIAGLQHFLGYQSYSYLFLPQGWAANRQARRSE
ncbi:thioredoxin H-type-like isoform X2 [Cucurbita moschata]|uniref:Thioredoxin H-type-like isoform X2 n=1 Tax=Cucurbita moschata TaxID=3662 RepID=A0A6J1EAG4_CUCMO|nr:thioredoxin H-type-like isoform X2 [Cucurbita moschata]